jgi:hypothetical protein
MLQERPRQSTTSVTKSIRLKTIPVATQLQNARDLLDGTTNVYLPRKQEFVLEWILDSLKGAKKNTYTAAENVVNGRIPIVSQIQFWRLFSAVWQDEGLDSISRKLCARKYSLVPILLETLAAASEAEAGDEQRDFLVSLNDAVEPLLKRTSEIKIRPQYGQGTTLLGAALSIANSLPPHDPLRDSFVMTFATIFLRSLLLEDRATKKLAKAFFYNVVCPALVYLVNSEAGRSTTVAVESCIQQAIFSPDNLEDYINALEAASRLKQDDPGFASLVNSITTSRTPSASFDGILAFLETNVHVLMVRRSLSSYSTSTWSPSGGSATPETFPRPKISFSIDIPILSPILFLTIHL